MAALEIQEHVRLITGVTLPIIDENAKAEGVRLHVGKTKESPDDFKSQEYAVLFKPDAIVLAGKDKEDYGKAEYWNPGIKEAYAYGSWPDLYDDKGTLHAAYDFLEDYCGVRWFDQSEFGTDVPQTKTLTVAVKDTRRTPAFRYLDPDGWVRGNLNLYNRETSLWTVGWSESTPKFQEWLDLIYENGRKLPVCKDPQRWLDYERGHVFAFLTRRKLGGEPFKNGHSLYGWYDRFWEKNPKNPTAFVERHADWFAQGYPDAKQPPQLCYSNPEVVKQCVADARAFFALTETERRKSSLGTDKFWSVVPMDTSSFCKCEGCQKLRSSECVNSAGFSRGDDSRLVWNFVNQVAKGLKQSNPDKMVSALAYWSYAQRPSGMPIEDNIAVQMCLFPHFAATNPKVLANNDMILKQWADGRPLYLWLYAGLTTGHKTVVPVFPKPMGGIWAGLLRKYQKAGVRGIFFNGFPQETDSYIIFKMADDPSRDVKTVIEDYFVRMYGPKAGKTLREFYELMVSIYANPRSYTSDAKGPELDWGVLGTGPRMAKLEALVKQAAEELAGSPKLWRKRFEMFKFGTWDYMREGRAAYEKSKVVKASAPIGMACPFGTDFQIFGGYNGWFKDNGDFSLRKISSAMRHDGKRLYMRFAENGLERAPGPGDCWEILFDKTHKLFVDSSGKTTGQVQGEGVPQEWSDHGAQAVSNATDRAWTLELSLPIPEKLLDKQGRLPMNCRRVDAKHEDTPVLVTTGDNFDAGKIGALVSFDKPLVGEILPPPDEDLLLYWDFPGDGDVVNDKSGHGNDGKLVGGKRVQGMVVFDGANQYAEAPKNFKPESYTFSCWLRYSNAKGPGGMTIFTFGAFHGGMSLPQQRLGVLGEGVDGKLTGNGPFGPELCPGQWHHFALACDGKDILVYEDGRMRQRFNAKAFKAAGPDAVWRFGGGPKFPQAQTFLGELSRVQFYNRALSPQEIMGKYRTESQGTPQ